MADVPPVQQLQRWHVDADSRCLPLSHSQDTLPSSPAVTYRLYRFLTDLEDILLNAAEDEQRLHQIVPRVQHLLRHSPWLELQAQPPNPKTGWSVSTLYEEFGYPLTVQLVSWQPGSVSTIHNHATWGLVALLNGQEKNTFWRRAAPSQPSGQGTALPTAQPLEQTGEQILQAGDIITFMPEAIHQIEALGDEPVVSFNLYGETQPNRRFKFDALTGAATPF